MAHLDVQPASDRRYVDWAAVFAGAVVATGVAIVFTTFAAALGLGAISVGPDGGISIWWLVVTAFFAVLSLVAANLLGGYIAGRMRRPVEAASSDEVSVRDGINGLAVWGLGMVVSAVLATSALTGVCAPPAARLKRRFRPPARPWVASRKAPGNWPAA